MVEILDELYISFKNILSILVALTLTLGMKYFSSRQCVVFGDSLWLLYNVLSVSNDPDPDPGVGTEVLFEDSPCLLRVLAARLVWR